MKLIKMGKVKGATLMVTLISIFMLRLPKAHFPQDGSLPWSTGLRRIIGDDNDLFLEEMICNEHYIMYLVPFGGLLR